MTKKLKLASVLFGLAALALYGLGANYTAAAPTSQAAGKSYTAMAGAMAYTEGEGSKPSWQMLKFYPDTITVNVGDSITWKFDAGPEPHTVTFLGPEKKIPEVFAPDTSGGGGQTGPPVLLGNPLVFFPVGGATYDGSAYTNSGVIAADIPGPKDYKLTFTKAGTYDYICDLHAFQMPDGSIVGMKAKVVVQEAGAATPKTPEQVMADANAMIAADKKLAADTEVTLNKTAKTTTSPNGTIVHQVTTGYLDTKNGMEYQRFYPKVLNVNQGDMVEWTETTGGFHTATFGEEPELLSIQPQASGPPKVILNPMFFPAGGATHTGTGYYNSGPMGGPQDPPEAGVKSYSLTFNQQGRYEYICITHYSTGMDATIVVNAAAGGTGSGTNPGMPRTGNGGEWRLFAFIALTALMLTSVGVAIRGRAAR